MSFHIGQMRRSQYDSYSTSLNYTLESFNNQANSVTTFKDKHMKLSGDNVVSSVYSYYLKFTVTQQPDAPQDFTIKLRTDAVTVDNMQDIRSLSVPQGTGATAFELIFNPNSTYNEIIFELKRTTADYDGTPREMNITVDTFARVNNVVTGYLKGKYPTLDTLKKIGIQGPPGLMFVIDGEEIKIGRSGIYELYNSNINISYIGFVIKDSAVTQNGEDYFIMDFKY